MADGDLSGRARPRVVILGGAPATGKTTLATPVAQSLQVPLLAKDLIKESLLDSFGATDLAASQKVGGAGWELLFLVAAWLLDARVGFVIEGNFEARAADRLRQIARRSHAVQVICQCSDRLSQERYERRASAPDRHHGHMDIARIQRGPRPVSDFGPFDLGVPTLIVDTTSDYHPTLTKIVAFVRGDN
ncbi:MAG TPA: AAA family ATPase [Candidatus Limnocylindria bacterium]